MAHEAGVAVITMQRAIEVLKKEHRIYSAPRRGTHINTESDANQPVTSFDPDISPDIEPDMIQTAPRWQTVKEIILEDIAKGIFPPGEMLPTSKELCIQYDTSPLTLRKVLFSLTKDKKISLYKNRYKVTKAPNREQGGTIVIIAAHFDIHTLSVRSPILSNFFSVIERQQYISRFNIEIFAYFGILGKGENNRSIAEIERTHTIIGYIIVDSSIPSGDLHALLHLLSTTKKPVGILDESGFYHENKVTRYNPNIRFFTLTNLGSNAGRVIGNYLFAKGHRKIGFITGHDVSWSRNRLQGCKKALITPENQDAVQLFTTNQKDRKTEFIQLDFYRKLNDIFPGKELSSLHFRSKYITQFLNDVHLFREMESVYEQAIQDSTISAWVGANDLFAYFGYFFLHKKNIPVPESISVVGFDNSFESQVYGITSYDFNATTALHAILQFLFTPTVVRLRERVRHVEIPGIIIERNSTNTKA